MDAVTSRYRGEPQIFAKSANFPFKAFQKSEKLKFRKTLPALPGENCHLTNEL